MSHSHHDGPPNDSNPVIPFPQKAHTLIEHWINHNLAHMQSYCQWADTFRQNGLESAAALLESASETFQQLNYTLSKVSELVDAPDTSKRSKSNL
jgi:ferritin